MGKKCEVCGKRLSKYFINIKFATNKEKVVEMCWFCRRRYLKIRERHLIMAFNELTEFMGGL